MFLLTWSTAGRGNTNGYVSEIRMIPVDHVGGTAWIGLLCRGSDSDSAIAGQIHFSDADSLSPYLIPESCRPAFDLACRANKGVCEHDLGAFPQPRFPYPQRLRQRNGAGMGFKRLKA